MRKRIALISFVSVVSALIVFVLFPELGFRNGPVSWVVGRMMRHYGYRFQAVDFQAHAHHLDWKTVEFSVSWEKASIESDKPAGSPSLLAIDGGPLHSSWTLQWLPLPLRLKRVDTLALAVPTARIRQALSQTAQSQNSFSLPNLNWARSIPDTLKAIELGQIDIRFSQIILTNDHDSKIYFTALNKPLKGTFLKAVGKQLFSNQLSYDLQVPTTEKGRVQWEELAGNGTAFFPGKGQATLEMKGTNRIQGKLNWVPVRKDGTDAHLEFEISSNHSHKMDLVLTGGVARIHPWLPAINIEAPCTIHLENPPTGNGLTVASECRFDARLAPPRLPKTHLLQSQTRTELAIKLNFSLDHEAANTPVRGRLEIDAKVPEIQNAIATLHETPWAVPAPLNNLTGAVDLKLRSQWKNWEAEAPFTVTTQLNSKEQALNTQADGKISVRLQPELHVGIEADWKLKQVRLSLPRIDPKNLPRFLSSKEIETSVSPAKKNLKSNRFDYAIHLYTEKNQPILVDSDLLKSPARIDLDSAFNSQDKPRISLRVESLPFEIFNRKAQLASFEYRISKQSEKDQIDGRLQLKSGEYEIYAHIYGSSEGMSIKLTSDPTVPEDELWAVVLFGAPFNSLDVDQQNSSQAAARALSHGALSLLSLYVFANTPIERVSYDPATQKVAVTFRIREGTSLEVGRSELSASELTLTRRLGRGWEFHATVSKSSDGDSNPGSAQAGAGLEWSSRY